MASGIGQKESFLHIFNDFVAGVMGGFTQVIVGQPFDTVKVRLQANVEYTSAWDCIVRMYKNEGLSSFFKGTLSPLLGTGFLVSLEMGGNEIFKKMLKKDGELLSNFELFFSGMMAGFVSTIVSAPVEHAKIRMQMQIHSNEYKGSIDALKKIYKIFGIRGIYKGVEATMLRELIPTGIYFMVYEIAKRKFQTVPGVIKFKQIFPAGSLAGFCFWLTAYPLDLIKTRAQNDNLDDPQYEGFRGVARAWKQVRQQGLRRHIPGFTICMIRSLLVYGSCFYIYEVTIKLLQSLSSH